MPGIAAEQRRARDRGGTEAVADVVERGIERLARAAVERQDELRDAVVEVRRPTMPTSVMPCCSISGRAVCRSARTASRIGSVCAVARGKRV